MRSVGSSTRRSTSPRPAGPVAGCASLDGAFGGDEVKRSAVREKLRSVRGMHSQLAHLGDTVTDMK
eukprot:2108688-Lingulodinium_polyedra.AAC.1